MAISIKKSIKVCCAIREMNQTQLAEAAGLTQPQLSYITRINSCSLDTIDKLAKALGCTASEFIQWGESE